MTVPDSCTSTCLNAKFQVVLLTSGNRILAFDRSIETLSIQPFLYYRGFPFTNHYTRSALSLMKSSELVCMDKPAAYKTGSTFPAPAFMSFP